MFGAKLMWGYFGDFTSLLRNIPGYRDLPLAELLPAAFPELTFVRVVRADKIRQAVSLWKAVQTATWRQDEKRRDSSIAEPDDESPPYRAFLEEHRPQLRFHYGAISHLLDQVMRDEAAWDAFFEHTGIKPILVLYENFAADYERSTLNLLDRMGLEVPPDLALEPRTRKQSDGVNDDWTRRYSELRLGTQFDLVPALVEPDRHLTPYSPAPDDEQAGQTQDHHRV